MKTLTKKQTDVYEYIKKYIKDNGYSPSMRDLSTFFNKSTGTIQPMLKRLRERKYISYDDKKARTIKILK